MRHDHRHSVHWLRGLALAGITTVGLITIVGSGGGVDGGNCGILFSNTCTFPTGPITPTPAAFVSPNRTIVQVGGTVTFTVDTNETHTTIQWRRSADGGASYVDIAGATDATYTLTCAQLADDGTVFLADLRQDGISIVQATATLEVSSLPGVVIEDGAFLPGDWAAATTPDLAASGAAHSESQVATGGHPDAFRQMTQALPVGPSSSIVFNTSQTHGYDPSTQGAIYVIDYTEDCTVFSGTASLAYVKSSLLIEQGERTYLSAANDLCTAGPWIAQSVLGSLRVIDLVLVAGPACNAGESCPDFSGSALPLRFGYARFAQQAAGSPASSVVHGIDNWKVTVWRR